MKVAFSIVSVLFGLALIVASCGPQKRFCPERMDNICVTDLDSGAIEEDSGTTICSPGFEYKYVDGGFSCVPTGTVP